MSVPDEATPHILIVDDDTRIRELLKKYLSDNGYRTSAAADAAQAQERMGALTYDLLVLDVMMPGINGLEFTERLRKAQNSVPILLLTARAEVEQRIEGLAMGADDYLPKPFEPKELLLRIHSILRRAAPVIEVKQAVEGPLKIGPWVFNPEREELIGDTETVRLTQAETRLLKALARTPGEIVTRDDLTDGSDLAGNTRTIDVQMNRLRRKVEIDPRNPRHLMTVRGEGYVLRPGD